MSSIDKYENVIHLPAPTKDAVLSVLLARYFKDRIYTDCGTILLAVNPYTELPNLYSEQKLRIYMDTPDKELNKQRPHPWKTASQAVRAMLENRKDEDDFDFVMKDQSILISGESGAGKTETTKIIMNFLANVGNVSDSVSDSDDDSAHAKRGRNNTKDHDSCEGFESLGVVQRKVLQTNRILDALGNARTVRNDNSSRFGKYIQLHFDTSGELRGSSLSTFLLETPRVVMQQSGERNFHIFYMICSETDESLRKTYKIKSVHHYDYLILSGGCVDRRDGVRDDTLYEKFLDSLAVLSADDNTIDGFLRSVMAVLTVGNASFTTSTNAAGDVVMHIDNDCKECLEDVSDLLGVEYDSLLKEMTTRVVTVNQEDFTLTLPQEQATSMRDVFAKTLYRAIFEWMIAFLNESMASDVGGGFTDTMGKIGLLDIFGFESLRVNSLEQLMINYANEHLQQHFDTRMIAAEQQLYIEEGIEWSFVKFPSADECIRLISGSNIGASNPSVNKKSVSLVALLDEACIIPSGSDATFMRQVYAQLDSNPRMANTKLLQGKGEFGVKHYAGVVVYNSKDFVVKNKNLHFPLDWLLRESSHPHMRMLAETDGAVVSEKTGLSPSKLAQQEFHQQGEGGERLVISGNRRKSVSAMKVATVSNTFCASVEDLMRTINATGVHYIKCFKPNDKQMKKNIMSDFMGEQLVCGGVIHTIQVTRTGFPVRFSYEAFYERYYALMVSLIREVFDESIDAETNVRVVLDSSTCELKKETDLLVEVAQGIDIVVQRLQMEELTGDLVRPTDADEDEAIGHCIQRGKTTVFLRSSGYATLEVLYDKLLGERAAVIQSFLRMLPVRADFLKAKRLVGTLEVLQLRQLRLKKWRRKLFMLRMFFRRCLYFARMHFKLVHLSIQVQRIYRNYVYRKRFWALIRFFRKVLAPIRRKIAGRKLSKMLSALFRRYIILREWQKLVRAMKQFFRVCGRYARWKIQDRRDRATRSICSVVDMYTCRKRYLNTLRAVACIQHWIRFGSFRTFMDHQNYIRSLFEVAVVPLQHIWRWKAAVHKNLEHERERLRNKAMAGSEDGASSQAFAKSSLVQQYTASRIDTVNTPDARTLLRVNKTPLWNLFCHYADKNATIPTAVDKKYSQGIVTRKELSKLLLDWGVQPAIMPMAGINLIADDVMAVEMEKRQCQVSPSKTKTPNRLVSFNNFCRILILLSSDLVRSPDLAAFAVRDRRRPIMSVRAKDAALVNPSHSPAVGHSLRWVLTAMDRSDGREKLRRARSSTLVSSFAGVLGAAAADTLDPSRSPPKPMTKAKQPRQMKSGPMASDVVEMFRRNEVTLVPMALHYSVEATEVNSVRKSYYSLLEVMPAMSMTKSIDTTKDSETELDSHEEAKESSSTNKSCTIRRSQTMSDSPPKRFPSPRRMSPPKRSMTTAIGYIEEESEENDEVYGGFVPGKVQPVNTFRAALIARDSSKRDAVKLSFHALWRLLSDFGVCPEHCSNKTDLRQICELVMEDAFPKGLDSFNYTQFTEVLDLIARNSRSNIATGSAANRLRSVFNSMNTSSGRNKVMRTDRNALALKALKLCEDPAEANLPPPAVFPGSNGIRSTTPTPGDRHRSTTPPPFIRRSQSAVAPRSKTPPPAKRVGNGSKMIARSDSSPSRRAGAFMAERSPSNTIDRPVPSSSANKRSLSASRRSASLGTPVGGSRQAATTSTDNREEKTPRASSAGRSGSAVRRSNSGSNVPSAQGNARTRPSSAGRYGLRSSSGTFSSGTGSPMNNKPAWT